MLYSRSIDYMFRPVAAIIRSLSFDIFKISLYKFAATCCCTINLNWRWPLPAETRSLWPRI